ncbi:hypothetical protein, partial [Escherichia coli]|uniref:hypothetical protein n=1 Tax=Escherichia coli TaxID=562 RepID=UPI002490B8EB
GSLSSQIKHSPGNPGRFKQPSVFWPDVIIFEMREVTCKTSPTVNFFQYFCNFRMGEHVINQTGKGRNTGRNEVA